MEETEDGIKAVGATVHSGSGLALGAIGIAVPNPRFDARLDDALIVKLFKSRDDVESDLLDFGAGSALGGDRAARVLSVPGPSARPG